MDLILRGANLADGRREQDIGIEAGRIVTVGPRLAATGRREIDVGGYLVSAPFVDAHFHMVATLSLGQISRIRLSDKTSRLHPRHVVPKRG
jgi:cytosine deaminase